MSSISKKKSILIISITNFVMAVVTIWLFIIITFETEQGVSVFTTTATIIASLFGLTTAFYLFSKQDKYLSEKSDSLEAISK